MSNNLPMSYQYAHVPIPSPNVSNTSHDNDSGNDGDGDDDELQRLRGVYGGSHGRGMRGSAHYNNSSREQLGKYNHFMIGFIVLVFLFLVTHQGGGGGGRGGGGVGSNSTSLSTMAADDDSNNQKAGGADKDDVTMSDKADGPDEETTKNTVATTSTTTTAADEKSSSNVSPTAATTTTPFDGKLAWLLCYPASGKTYTLALLRELTGMTPGTNYGKDETGITWDQHGENYPIFPNKSPRGPFWINPIDYAIPSTNKPGKMVYAPTVTHCTGCCLYCKPQEFVQTLISFDEGCRMAIGHPHGNENENENDKNNNNNQLQQDDDEEGEEEGTSGNNYHDNYYLPPNSYPYNINLVGKAVHLIRHPLGNTVSRFNLERRARRRGDGFNGAGGVGVGGFMYEDNDSQLDPNEWLNKYPFDSKGFHSWCESFDDDDDSITYETSSRFFSRDILDIVYGEEEGREGGTKKVVSRIPCHDEFFRWIQWHNLVVSVLEYRQLNSTVIYFEDYHELTDTKNRLMAFLELEDDVVGKTKEPPEFRGANIYKEFYTKPEIDLIWKLLEAMAMPKVWELIKRYKEI